MHHIASKNVRIPCALTFLLYLVEYLMISWSSIPFCKYLHIIRKGIRKVSTLIRIIKMLECKHFHIQFIQKTANLWSLCLSSSFSVFALLLQGKEFVTDSNHLLANVWNLSIKSHWSVNISHGFLTNLRLTVQYKNFVSSMQR